MTKFYRITVAGEMPEFYVLAADISDALDVAQRITGYHIDLLDAFITIPSDAINCIRR
jgi:hypothetical protein